jgi:hypothetical protein
MQRMRFYAGQSSEKAIMKPDLALIEQIILNIEKLSSAHAVHLVSSLIGSYRAALEEYGRTRNEAYRTIALNEEKALRFIRSEYCFQKEKRPSRESFNACTSRSTGFRQNAPDRCLSRPIFQR